MQMIQAKSEGQTVTEEAPKHRAPVIDLMQALQKSLGDLPRKPATKAGPTEMPAPKKGASKRQTTRVANG